MAVDQEQQTVYLMLLGAKATLPPVQQRVVDEFVEQINLIAQSDTGKLAIAIVGAKLASES